MLALSGAYAPTIFRVRQRGLRRGNDPHICPRYRLILVQEGAISFIKDGIRHTAKDGDVCLLPPNIELTIERQETIRSI